jgi:predicted nucleic acid-binding protein
VGVILDTSVLIAAERGRLSASDIARAASGAALYVAPPVIAELGYGAIRAKDPARRARRAAFVSTLSGICPCLPIDGATGAAFARVAASLDSRGRPAAHRTNDLWIAALALRHRMKVMTLNVKDFADIPGLEVLVPEAGG